MQRTSPPPPSPAYTVRSIWQVVDFLVTGGRVDLRVGNFKAGQLRQSFKMPLPAQTGKESVAMWPSKMSIRRMAEKIHALTTRTLTWLRDMPGTHV